MLDSYGLLAKEAERPVGSSSEAMHVGKERLEAGMSLQLSFPYCPYCCIVPIVIFLLVTVSGFRVANLCGQKHL